MTYHQLSSLSLLLLFSLLLLSLISFKARDNFSPVLFIILRLKPAPDVWRFGTDFSLLRFNDREIPASQQPFSQHAKSSRGNFFIADRCKFD